MIGVVERARLFLHSRFSVRLRLTTLAQECGLSIFHLIRVFRRSVGMPPHEYLTLVRVSHARAMLRQGSSIADVAYACGFSDQSHLTRVFKKTLGMPPGEYVRLASRAMPDDGRAGTDRLLSNRRRVNTA
jgi:AraC-like DNA-binding protein